MIKDHVDSLACLLCDTTDPRIGCTHALIPNRIIIPRHCPDPHSHISYSKMPTDV
jgi:hypothetical protein